MASRESSNPSPSGSGRSNAVSRSSKASKSLWEQEKNALEKEKIDLEKELNNGRTNLVTLTVVEFTAVLRHASLQLVAVDGVLP
eukprot:scaffold3034_cov110-Skeletonema_dohrnii-CCMP3373.AAC.4